ncbi:hypothetical protein CkaCkLH20_12614 [Colletotrichum karsti]|uniref:Uncharacterized protein n=1 Tax=Colletotrichum karsti TaxID=1095194 RepID=A0A9P6HSF6_9PEZI|nr:uncharacterized protein CkaCkLH20_12614 [Colletotrichum karsti]KAF9869907.1 hypothetical protein CkaCkLH20_12614 [Colletotrichum karsti]
MADRFERAFRLQQELNRRGVSMPRLLNANNSPAISSAPNAAENRPTPSPQPQHRQTVPPATRTVDQTARGRDEVASSWSFPAFSEIRRRVSDGWSWTAETVASNLCEVWHVAGLMGGCVRVVWIYVHGVSSPVLCFIWRPIKWALIIVVIVLVVLAALFGIAVHLWDASNLAIPLSFVLSLGQGITRTITSWAVWTTSKIHAKPLGTNTVLTMTASVSPAPAFTPALPVVFIPKGLAPEFRDFENCMDYLSKIPIGAVQPRNVPKSVSIVWDVLAGGGDNVGSRNEGSLTGPMAWSSIWDQIHPSLNTIRVHNVLVTANETRQFETESAQAARLLQDMRQRPAAEEPARTSGFLGWLRALFGPDGVEEARKQLVNVRLSEVGKMVEKSRNSRQWMHDTVRNIPDTSMKEVKETRVTFWTSVTFST